MTVKTHIAPDLIATLLSKTSPQQIQMAHEQQADNTFELFKQAIVTVWGNEDSPNYPIFTRG